MRTQATFRRIARSIQLIIALLALTRADLLARPGGDSATEGALVFTGVLTLVIIALAFLVLIIPAQDRKRLAEAAARLRGSFAGGRADRPVMLNHDFDGIRELDNKIPPWFTTLFSVTILFGAAYLLDYHVFHSSKLSGEEYVEEVAAADIQRRIALAGEGNIDENALVALTDATALARGKEQFARNCVSCHGPLAGGGVGPNLTDDYWIHGGGIRNIYTSVKNGWPEKGMISWKLVFTPKQMQEIASYVMTLRGTHPPGAKAPQGDLYVDKDTTSTVAQGMLPGSKDVKK